MSGLSSEFYQRCRSTLLKCSEFDSDASLRAVFAINELRPFRDRVSSAATQSERVDKCLEFLLDQKLSDGRPVLVLFLEALRDRYQPGDALRDELGRLIKPVQSTLATSCSSTLGTSRSPRKSNIQDHQGYPRDDVQADKSQESPPERKTGSFLMVFASAVLGFATGILGNLVAAWIQQDLLHNTFGPIGITSILVLTVAGLVIGVLLQRGKSPVQLRKARYWGLVAVVTSVVIMALVLAWYNAMLRPPTVYFVVDATREMTPFFNDVQTQVQIAAAGIPTGSKVGLRVYGGQLSGMTDCQDTTQLLDLGTYENVQQILDSVLSEVSANGHSSLTNAILETIYSDLPEQTGPIRIIVITSGPDSLCDPQVGGILESRAKEIRLNIDVLIISVGELTPQKSNVLESYAIAFGGNHINVKTASDLPSVIESVSSYGSNYFLENSTPQPEQ